MGERTEGWRPDAGDGRKPITLASSSATESKAQVAYRAYLDHALGCEDCRQAAFECDQAAALWGEYRTARAEA